jgi:hypothetical protein
MPEKIIYEPHPCSPERKKELRDKGYKIIDARFDPDATDEVADETEVTESSTVAQIKAALDARGIDYNGVTLKADLFALLSK